MRRFNLRCSVCVAVLGIGLVGGTLLATDPESLAGVDLKNTLLPPLARVQPPGDLQSLSRTELRNWQSIGRTRQAIERQLRGFRLTPDMPRDKPHVDDHFVVALFHVADKGKTADIRFMKLSGIEGNAQRLAYYSNVIPPNTVRLYQVLDRRKSADAAQASLANIREHYESAKDSYQAKLLQMLGKKQATQPIKMRRC